jgi:hypothetical protein
MSNKLKSVLIKRRQQIIERFDSKEAKEIVFVVEEQEFDEQGRLVCLKKYSQPDELEEKTIKYYGGNIVTTEYYIDENDLSEKYVTETDGNGKIIKETMYYADGTESVSEFEYVNDKPSKKITVDIDDDENEVSGIHSWIYDDFGNLIREEENEYDEITFYREMKYDDKNRMTEETTFHIADGRPSHENMEWDNDKLSKLIKTDIYGNKSASLYKYNANGEIESIQYLSKEHNSTTNFEYDSNNNPIHEKEVDDNQDVLYEVFREYDMGTKKL